MTTKIVPTPPSEKQKRNGKQEIKMQKSNGKQQPERHKEKHNNKTVRQRKRATENKKPNCKSNGKQETERHWVDESGVPKYNIAACRDYQTWK